MCYYWKIGRALYEEIINDTIMNNNLMGWKVSKINIWAAKCFMQTFKMLMSKSEWMRYKAKETGHTGTALVPSFCTKVGVEGNKRT